MTSDLKGFIEEYIDLIDQEDWTTLLDMSSKSDYDLSNDEVTELISILTSIGADLDEAREDVLDFYINELITHLCTDISKITIFYFFQKYLTHWLGYTFSELANYLIKHAEYFGITIKDDPIGSIGNYTILFNKIEE